MPFFQNFTVIESLVFSAFHMILFTSRLVRFGSLAIVRHFTLDSLLSAKSGHSRKAFLWSWSSIENVGDQPKIAGSPQLILPHDPDFLARPLRCPFGIRPSLVGNRTRGRLHFHQTFYRKTVAAK